MSAAPISSRTLSALAVEVRASLSRSPKRLDSRLFYDALGSQLFEAICRLPWYRITRAETALLAKHAGEIVASVADLATVIELGPGSGDKLATLVGATEREIEAHLVDVSSEALDQARRAMSTRAHVAVIQHVATYELGLARAMRESKGRGARLVLFLGSNVGNFDPSEARAFLASVRRAMEPGDALLLGADLVKPERDLILAYDDPLGVTAAFNKNILRRLNDELGAEFDLDAWAHLAEWNRAASRVEMHLVSKRRQTVRIAAAEASFAFEEGERIWTESSHKYRAEGLDEMGARAGLRRARRWIDEESGFAETLFVADDR